MSTSRVGHFLATEAGEEIRILGQMRAFAESRNSIVHGERDQTPFNGWSRARQVTFLVGRMSLRRPSTKRLPFYNS